MEDYQGYNVGFFLNNAEKSLPANQFSFIVSDNIYTSFPTLKLYTNDATGLFLESGAFSQGAPLSIKYGYTDSDEMLSADFRVSSRNDIALMTGSTNLNGKLEVQGVHASFFSRRESLNKAFKRVTASDIVKELLSAEDNLFVENTSGHIEAYATDDLYRFVREKVLPQATNRKARPYYFFRNLHNEVYFESIDNLENRFFVEELIYGGENTEDHVYNVINVFLPFNEKLEDTLINFHVDGVFINSDLSYEYENVSVATDIKDFIPVITNTRIPHVKYFGRQFNPDVDYNVINVALCANAIRAGILIDKVLLKLVYHPALTAGRIVNIKVSLYGEDDAVILSEVFSGTWLIEQSTHLWNGAKTLGMTELVLCRSQMKPRQDSLIRDLSFRD